MKYIFFPSCAGRNYHNFLLDYLFQWHIDESSIYKGKAIFTQTTVFLIHWDCCLLKTQRIAKGAHKKTRLRLIYIITKGWWLIIGETGNMFRQLNIVHARTSGVLATLCWRRSIQFEIRISLSIPIRLCIFFQCKEQSQKQACLTLCLLPCTRSFIQHSHNSTVHPLIATQWCFSLHGQKACTHLWCSATGPCIHCL